MTKNVNESIEKSALREEKVLSNSGGDGGSVLGVISRKNIRGDDEVKWAEAVRKLNGVMLHDPAETSFREQTED